MSSVARNPILNVIAATALLVISDCTLACSCIGSTLASHFAGSDNVFIARMTSATLIEGKNLHARSVSTGFEVTERFKGAIPFDRLRSHPNGASCGISLQIGVEYLVFAPDSGEVGLCTGIQRVPMERPAGSEFVSPSDILKAWSAGETPDLSDPWFAGNHDGQCWLSTMADTVAGASILHFRANSRVTESGRLHEIRLGGYLQPGSVSVQVGATEYQTDWVKSDNYRHSVHMLRGDDAAGLLRALATVDRIQVSGRDVESAEINTVFSTANNGGAIDAMLKCMQAPVSTP